MIDVFSVGKAVADVMTVFTVTVYNRAEKSVSHKSRCKKLILTVAAVFKQHNRCFCLFICLYKLKASVKTARAAYLRKRNDSVLHRLH